ncbi:PREDICTED: uncharacterized protein LOC109163920, partial [Ipomoea nil]|uniref:uncharacterized protein LOC109163920 n=1 Tax=Ipomoea nil TaxID=35883 RepID=UPI00090087E1
MLVPTELTKVEKFVAGLNYKARKALTVSRPSSLKDTYVCAADLYRVQQLQRGSFEQARKRSEGGSSSTFKKSKPSFPARIVSSSSQGPIRMEHGNQAKESLCQRCGKMHVGQGCNGFAFRCFRCGDRGHKIAECPQLAGQRALPPPPGAGGASGAGSGRGAVGARPPGRVFVMARSQAESVGLVEEELT